MLCIAKKKENKKTVRVTMKQFALLELEEELPVARWFHQGCPSMQFLAPPSPS